MLDAVPKMCGKELEKEGEAWMEAKWILPMLSLVGIVLALNVQQEITPTHESLNPNVAFAWLMVI